MLRTHGRSPPQSPCYNNNRNKRGGVKLTRKHSQFPNDSGGIGENYPVFGGSSSCSRRKLTGRSLSDSIFVNRIDDLVMHLETGGVYGYLEEQLNAAILLIVRNYKLLVFFSRIIKLSSYWNLRD